MTRYPDGMEKLCQAFAPDEIRGRAICINGDFGEIIGKLRALMEK